MTQLLSEIANTRGGADITTSPPPLQLTLLIVFVFTKVSAGEQNATPECGKAPKVIAISAADDFRAKLQYGFRPLPLGSCAMTHCCCSNASTCNRRGAEAIAFRQALGHT